MVNATVQKVDVVIPMASYGVSGFVASRVSIAEAEAMLNQKMSPHPEINHESLLSSMDMIGMRHYGGGLPISEVRTGGPAEGAGLQVWDVIVKVGDQDVRKESANTIVRELLNSRNGLFITVLRSSKTPSGPVEVFKKKKKSKIFGCFSFSSNANTQSTGGVAPEKRAPMQPMRPMQPFQQHQPAYEPQRAYGVPYNLPYYPSPVAAPAAPALMPSFANESVENVNDFSMMVEQYTDKENQLGQRGYMFDDDGPVYHPGVIMAY